MFDYLKVKDLTLDILNTTLDYVKQVSNLKFKLQSDYKVYNNKKKLETILSIFISKFEL